MNRLALVLSDLVNRIGLVHLSEETGVPKRTLSRWVSALRDGDLSNWSADVLLHICEYEFLNWGSSSLHEAFLPTAGATYGFNQLKGDVLQVENGDVWPAHPRVSSAV